MTAAAEHNGGAAVLAVAAAMDSAVAAFLRDGGLTLAVAESCSGGLLSKRITDIPGCSAYFLLGAVTYANSAKTAVLQVPEEILVKYGAVSAEVAIAMADGVRAVAGSDLALATTGIAGPDGGSSEKPVGTVYIAIVDGSGCEVRHYLFSGDRETVRNMTATAAMELLYSHLAALVKNNSANNRE